MGKLASVLVVVGIGLVGVRFKSKFELMERAASYQQALSTRALGVRPGMSTVPSEMEIRESAETLAKEFKLDASDIRISVEQDAAPTGAGAHVANQIGGLTGAAVVDADGNVQQAPARHLTTTLASVQVHILAKGFMCSLERDVSARKNFGYALQ